MVLTLQVSDSPTRVQPTSRDFVSFQNHCCLGQRQAHKDSLQVLLVGLLGAGANSPVCTSTYTGSSRSNTHSSVLGRVIVWV